MLAPFIQAHSLALLGGGVPPPLLPLPHAENERAAITAAISVDTRDFIPYFIPNLLF
jgi:hypothetical protein